MPSDILVTKSNNLIQATYRLTLQEQRLILGCIAKINSRDETPKTMKLTAREYADNFKISISDAYKDIYSAADKLYDRSIEIKTPGAVTKFRWIQKQVNYEKGGGEIEITWSDDIFKYISQLKEQFTSYKLKHVSNLQSIHSIRIYELLMQWRKTGKLIIEVEKLRELLGLKDKYPTFKGFNQRVILMAINELNLRSDLTITMKTIKKGRVVYAIEFNFKINDQMKMDI